MNMVYVKTRIMYKMRRNKVEKQALFYMGDLSSSEMGTIVYYTTTSSQSPSVFHCGIAQTSYSKRGAEKVCINANILLTLITWKQEL